MKISEFLIHITILITLSISLNRCENECCFNSSFAHTSNLRTILYSFDNFDQLKFKCDTPIRVRGISFFPLIPLILNNSLNMNNVSIWSPYTNFFTFSFHYLSGFDIDSNPFKYLNYISFNSGDISYFISHGNMDFYSNNSLIDYSLCNEKLNGWSLLSIAKFYPFL